jgi:hypothetical protein
MCTTNMKLDLYYVNVCKHEHENTYQGHKEPQEQKLKRRFKFNFQTRNKIRSCDLETKT